MAWGTFQRLTIFSSVGVVLFTSSLGLSQSRIDFGAESSPPSDVYLNSKSAGNASLRISVDLVLVPVTVADASNHPQTGLSREDFRIYEGKQIQQIRYFSNEDSPISVGLLLDVSKSMHDKIETERAAVDQFFKNANPEDDYFVITFNSQPYVLSDVTQSINGIETELGLVQPGGSTALLDAVYLGISKLRNAKYLRRALVMISDGADNSSRYKFREIKSIIAESDVMLYAVGIFDSTPFKSFEEAMGSRWLSAMTDVTGGHTLTIQSVKQLPEQCAVLSRELRSQYVLGYEPRDRAADGKWHKIKVVMSVDPERLHAFYRKGYFAPNP